MEKLDLFGAYIPTDRRLALSLGRDLPNRVAGAALFADISGFTPLTETLSRELGPRQGAEELTKHLNAVYGALIVELDQFGGSVIGFSGDAITCWLDGDDGTRAVACGLAMQRIMAQFAQLQPSTGAPVLLSIKIGISVGPACRFRVGDSTIQYLDVLAGSTIDCMAAAEKLARKGEIVVTAAVADRLADNLEVSGWRADEINRRFAAVSNLTDPVDPVPWPKLDAITLTEVQARPWLLPPIYERLKAGSGRFLAEIRPTTALFLRFGELDYDQDEAAGDKLDAYIGWVQRVLTNYGGYLLQLTFGDKGSYFYAGFGAPLFHEDHSVRAVAAAIDLLSPPPYLDFITRTQIGLSRGSMWTGAYGGATRHTYGVLGDEANVAARLMQQAGLGQILASQRVVKTLTERYTCQYQGAFKVKGKDEPIPAWLVVARKNISPQRPITLFPTPLIGRQAKLGQMQQALATVQANQGVIIRLEGKAGLGKSHLAAEFAERALRQGFRLAVGVSQSTSQEMAYYPWRHIFQNLLGLSGEPALPTDPTAWQQQQSTLVETVLVETNPTWRLRLPLLGDLLHLPLADNDTTRMFDPKLRREALFALLTEILQTWATRQPLLLLFEDAHWLDEASRQLLLALARVIANSPILLLLVHRPQAEPLLPDLNRAPNYVPLNLGELSEAEIASLVAQRLSGQLSPLALALIQARAQGNPFFAEEMIATLREAGGLRQQPQGDWQLSAATLTALRQANCLVKQAGDWILAPAAPLETAKLGVPETIQDIILSRIDHLPETHRLTLKAASVIGRTFEVELLTQIHPESLSASTLTDLLQQLEKRDLVRLETSQPYLTYMFRHNLTHEAVNQLLTEDLSHLLHYQVGLALERWQPNTVERLAYHFSRSDLNQPEVCPKAVLYLDQAARKTQREYANDMALNYYNQALALEERWEWRQGQVEVLHLLGQRDQEQAALNALEKTAGAPVWTTAYLWGQYYEAISEYDQAQAAGERALAACRESGNSEGEFRCLTQLGLIAFRHGDYEGAKAQYYQALTLSQDEVKQVDEVQSLIPVVNRLGLVYQHQVLNRLGLVYQQQGDLDQAEERHKQALALSGQHNYHLDEAESLNHLGITAYYKRHLAEAVTYHQQALQIRQEIGDRAGEGMSCGNLGVVLRDSGDYSQAQSYLSTALAIQQAIGNRWNEMNIWNDLGGLYWELGELSNAQRCLERGLQLSQDIEDEVGEAYILSNLGLTTGEKGDLTTALAQLTRGLALAQAHDERDLASGILSYLSLFNLRAGHVRQAIEQAQAALTLQRELKLTLRMTDNLATLAAAYLTAGNIVEALNYTQLAWVILEECRGEGPEFPQRDYFVCYQVLAAGGQMEQAHAALQSAYNLVMARANKITDSALQQSFLQQVRVNREIVQEYESLNP